MAAVTLAETVIQGATAIPAPRTITARVGKPLPITVHLSSTAAASIAYTGTLNIEDQDGHFLGFATIEKNGAAKFLLSGIAAGAYLCKINYSGDPNHQGGTSVTFALNIS